MQNAAAGSFTPGNLMWLGALLLLLGTVGVLVTARIALAVLLALGPVFVVLALFSGTRGLTAGWLRGVVLTAITPLFVVLGGGLMTELLVPVVSALRSGEGIDGRAAVALFMIASIHIALMAMVMRVIGTMVSGWQVFGLARQGESSRDGAAGSQGQSAASAAYAPADPREAQSATGTRRSAALVPVMATTSDAAAASGAAAGSGGSRSSRTIINQTGDGLPAQPLRQAPRSRGVGSRFRSHSPSRREMIR